MKASERSSTEFRFARDRAEASARALAAAVRAALGTLAYESGGARSCGRALRLERTLGWKLWRVAHASDLPSLLRTLPGRRGWDQILLALQRQALAPAATDGVRAAAREMLAIVGELQRHPALFRALGGGGVDRAIERERMVAARRKASRANERVHGLHAGLTAVTALIAPKGRSRNLSLACAATFDRISRSRPGMPWPLYARLATLDTRTGTRKLGTPVDRTSPLEPIVLDLCSGDALDGALKVGERDGGVFLEIADLHAGPSGDFRVSTAEYVRSTGTPAKASLDPVHLRLGIYLPTDLVVLGVLTHRSMPLTTTPAPWLCGTPLSIRSLGGWHEETRLPLEGESEPIAVGELGKGIGTAGPVHLALLRRTAAALGTGLDEFVAHRVRVPFPPLFGSVFMSFELAPAASVERARRREHRDP